MDDMTLVEIFSSRGDCPVEGCPFEYSIKGCLSEEEAVSLLSAVIVTHAGDRHPGAVVNLGFMVSDIGGIGKRFDPSIN